MEQGSVGSALVRISPNEPPRIFGEFRTHLPLGDTRNLDMLARQIEQAAAEAILHAAEVASRVRMHPAAGRVGVVERAAVFLSPPWGAPNISRGEPEFLCESSETLRGLLRAHLDVPHGLHTRAGAALHAARVVFPGDTLLIIIGAETTELLRAKDGAATHYALVPAGSHAVLRTLRAHGLSWHEARSAVIADSGHLSEPLEATYDYLAKEFSIALRGMGNAPSSALVIAREPLAERLARELARQREFSTLFPQGSTIRSFDARHATPYVAAHAQRPDLSLLIEALYLDFHLGGVEL